MSRRKVLAVGRNRRAEKPSFWSQLLQALDDIETQVFTVPDGCRGHVVWLCGTKVYTGDNAVAGTIEP